MITSISGHVLIPPVSALTATVTVMAFMTVQTTQMNVTATVHVTLPLTFAAMMALAWMSVCGAMAGLTAKINLMSTNVHVTHRDTTPVGMEHVLIFTGCVMGIQTAGIEVMNRAGVHATPTPCTGVVMALA